MRRGVKIWLWLLIAVIGIAVIIFVIGPALFASVAYPLPKARQEALVKYSLEYGISPNFLAALIFTESHWKENAQSGAGAVGLTQFIPSTARAVAQRLGVSPFTPNDLKSNPDMSIRFGAYYISDGIKRYGGDEKLALIAYNGGGGAVNAYRAGNPVRGTVAYANKILSVESIYDQIYGKWWERPDLPDLSTQAKGSTDLLGTISISDFWRNLLFTQEDLPSEGQPATEQNDFGDFWKTLVPGT